MKILQVAFLLLFNSLHAFLFAIIFELVLLYLSFPFARDYIDAFLI